MDLRQLQRFVTIAEMASFAGASKELNLSQPALTRSIQMLEESVEVLLFERGPRGVRLTSAGEQLMPRAKAILHERDRAISAIANSRRDETHGVVLGSLPRLSSRVLCKPLLTFTDAHPDVEVRVIEDDLSTLIKRMHESTIDFCFGVRDSGMVTDAATFEPLLDQEAIIVARKDHPLHRQLDISFADLCAQRWIVLDSEETRVQWRAMFLRRELPVPKSVIWTRSWDMMQAALVESDSVMTSGALGIAHLVDKGQVLVLRAEDRPFWLKAGLFLPVDRKPSRLAAELIDRIRLHCRTMVYENTVGFVAPNVSES